MKTKRLEEIKNYIIKQQSATYEELCAHFDVSLSTMRRDIDEIIESGELVKVYGGVKAGDGAADTSFMDFDYKKDTIARKASELIKDGDVIFLGSGTTVGHMAPYLKDKKITVITNNLIVLLNATRYGFKVVSIGGTLDSSTVSFVGTYSVKQISEMNADIAFIGCNAINEQCISNINDMEAEIKKAMIRSSAKTAVLAESDKFNRTSLYNCSQLEDISIIVTDVCKSEELKRVFKEKAVELIEGE